MSKLSIFLRISIFSFWFIMHRLYPILTSLFQQLVEHFHIYHTIFHYSLLKFVDIDVEALFSETVFDFHHFHHLFREYTGNGGWSVAHGTTSQSFNKLRKVISLDQR